MNIKKLTAAALAAATSAALTAAVPEISGVTMAQDVARRVTITYTLADAPAVVTLDVQTNANTSAAADDPGWTSIGGEAVWNATGDVWKKVETGSRTITWRPDHSWPDHKIADGGARAVVTAWALDNTPDYMAVDISAAAQQNTQRYYPAADFVPGGVTNDEYKTSTLLMRKIMAKDVEWTMGSTGAETQRTAVREATHRVTLTNNYYIGVYEMTQSQWYEIAGYNNSNFTAERSMRPVEKVCYNEIRLYGNSNAAATADQIAASSWPNEPSSDSFLGKLKARTGIYFDLPSEAQWEFAARAGHGSGYWGDGTAVKNADTDANLGELGRYKNNGGGTATTATLEPSAGGTDIVGSHKPNDWGLYDMHGNVWEWCLDWYQNNIATAKDASDELYGGRVNIDPSTPANYLSGASASGASRVLRGGSWNYAAGYCRPAFRGSNTPTCRNDNLGFRVLCSAGLR